MPSWEALQEYRLLPGAIVILLAVYAIYRRLEVRLTLLVAALLLGVLAGDVPAIVHKFFTTFVDEKFVVPICTAMGFAYVLRSTQCDQHLVHLLLRPLRHARPLLIPGTVVVGFLVNMPIVSQTSTAVTLGTVVVPLLLAARFSPATIGAALLLGSSIGGELLNPAAPELRTVATVTDEAAVRLGLAPLKLTGADCVERIAPLNFLGLAVATAVFWYLSARAERRIRNENVPEANGQTPSPGDDAFQVSLVRAAVPLVPLVLLYLVSPPLELFEVPRWWLVSSDSPPGLKESRMIGAAMLIGAAVAAIVVRRKAGQAAAEFFQGAGFGFANIISLIVAAACFGEGIRLIGVADLIGWTIQRVPELLLPLAGVLSLGFAALCGSGMATAQSLFGFFADSAFHLDVDPARVGAVVSLAAAAGRTMSPVAAVTLMCASMTQTDPLTLAKRVAIPLLASTGVIILAAMLIA